MIADIISGLKCEPCGALPQSICLKRPTTVPGFEEPIGIYVLLSPVAAGIFSNTKAPVVRNATDGVELGTADRRSRGNEATLYDRASRRDL